MGSFLPLRLILFSFQHRFIRVVLLLHGTSSRSNAKVQILDLHTGDAVNKNLHIRHQPGKIVVADDLGQ